MINLNSYEFCEYSTIIFSDWKYVSDAFKEYIEQGMQLAKVKDELLQKNTSKDELNEWQKDMTDLDNYLQVHYFKISFLNSGIGFIISQLEFFLKEIEEYTYYVYLKERKKAPRISQDVLSGRKDNILSTANCKIEFNQYLTQTWGKILDYQKIRNAIVHRNGQEEDINLIKRWQKKYGKLQIHKQGENHTLVLTSEFLLDVESEVTQFLDGLMRILHSKEKIISHG